MKDITIGNVNDLAKLTEIPERIQKTLKPAVSEMLDRTAFRARRSIQAEMPNDLDRPTKQVINAVRVQKTQKRDDLDSMQSVVFLTNWASAFLADDIAGQTITTLNEREPVLVPNIKSLQRSQVRRKLGKLVNEKTGNVVGLRSGKIRKILENKTFVFEITNRAHPWLVPGIYFRHKRNDVARGNEQGLFTLFTYVDSADRKAIFPYFDIGRAEYERSIPELWPVEFRKSYARFG